MRPFPSKSIAKRRTLPGMNWGTPIAPANEPFGSSGEGSGRARRSGTP
jgi:hypothetical protein